jgi:hypothetical protein
LCISAAIAGEDEVVIKARQELANKASTGYPLGLTSGLRGGIEVLVNSSGGALGGYKNDGVGPLARNCQSSMTSTDAAIIREIVGGTRRSAVTGLGSVEFACVG